MLIKIALALLSLVSAAGAGAAPLTFAGAATFHAAGTAPFGLFDIDGGGIPVKGSVDIAADGTATGTLTGELAGIVTGQDMRDGHARNADHLDVARYPQAKLTLGRWKPTTAPSPFCGTLTIKAETHPVCGEASVTDGDGARAVKATFPVRFALYPSMGAPTFAGSGVKDPVTVTVTGTAR